MRSVVVVLPASMCAMMPILRIDRNGWVGSLMSIGGHPELLRKRLRFHSRQVSSPRGRFYQLNAAAVRAQRESRADAGLITVSKWEIYHLSDGCHGFVLEPVR